MDVDYFVGDRKSFADEARAIVLDQIQRGRHHPTLTIDDIYVVWFCKTLQNWKALVSTTVVDGKYFEITHNGDLNETYVDTYVKVSNVIADKK